MTKWRDPGRRRSEYPSLRETRYGFSWHNEWSLTLCDEIIWTDTIKFRDKVCISLHQIEVKQGNSLFLHHYCMKNISKIKPNPYTKHITTPVFHGRLFSVKDHLVHNFSHAGHTDYVTAAQHLWRGVKTTINNTQTGRCGPIQWYS